MFNRWKKNFVIVGLVIVFSLAVLYTQVFHDNPGVEKTPFIFLFLGYVVLFPLIITTIRPRLSRYVYQYHRRGPPLD
jgi:hypothetical protein